MDAFSLVADARPAYGIRIDEKIFIHWRYKNEPGRSLLLYRKFIFILAAFIRSAVTPDAVNPPLVGSMQRAPFAL